MRNLSGLNFDAGGNALGPTDAQRTEHVMIERPLQRILSFCRRSIDDVVNSPLAKNEVLGYWKVYRQIRRGEEVISLEKQWNPLG
jgi:hypothetical protein